MQTIALLGFSMFFTMLVLVASVTPRRSLVSMFELERRRQEGSESAADELKREVLLDDVLSVKRVAEALLLVFVVMVGVVGFGSLFGVVVSLAVALGYGRLSRIEAVHTVAMRLYEQLEPKLLILLERHPVVARVIRSVTQTITSPEISSREELEHLVDELGHILTTDEKRLISNGLRFSEKTVESIMTPRGVIETIGKQELIGPLVLDTLHKTGHSRFPVIDGDIDHVVGVLHIKDLLTINNKKSETAGKAMEAKVFYINQEQTLQHALAAFISTRHHLFIVVNGYRETAGILTLEDVIEALLGREIVDEFDVHDDLRIVAERSAKTNNNPPHHKNV
ncbi:MAG: CBS domain-containing protein [Candidatus Saccharimonas sp.]